MSESDFLIRRYNPEDLTRVLEIWESAARIVYPFFSENDWDQERHQVANLYLPNAETWVCCIDRELVGFISMLGSEIGGLFVAPDRQRHRIGSRLVDFVQQGQSQLKVEVFSSNTKGIEFYKKQGFESFDQYQHSTYHELVLRMRRP